MSKKATKEHEKTKHPHAKGSKAGIQFKKLSTTELTELASRRAAGESEDAIAADFRRRKRA